MSRYWRGQLARLIVGLAMFIAMTMVFNVLSLPISPGFPAAFMWGWWARILFEDIDGWRDPASELSEEKSQ